MRDIWDLSWMWTTDVRDSIQKLLQCNVVDEDVTTFDFLPDKSELGVRDFRGAQEPLPCDEVDDDVTIMDSLPGESELGLAVRCGRETTVESLLSDSADPNERDAWGQTLLFHAVKRGNFEIIALLLLAGADPTRTSHAGLSAFDVADDKHATALLQALAPIASRVAPDTCDLLETLEALPAELRTRFDEAMGGKRKMAL